MATTLEREIGKQLKELDPMSLLESASIHDGYAPSEQIQLSLAISAKRQADALVLAAKMLEEIDKTLTQFLPS